MKASEAIVLLEPIPKEDFIEDKFTDSISKCCVIGHLTRLASNDPNDYSQSNCKDVSHRHSLRTLSRQFLIQKDEFGDIVEVNNGIYTVNGYYEDNPKDRVMHLLKDMEAAGF